MLQEKFQDIAIKLRNTNFKGSNDWLECFRKRLNISRNQVYREFNNVNFDDVNEWKSKIGELIKDYNGNYNIQNCDETGLFFRAIPSKTLKLKGEQCKGGKLSKERIIVLLWKHDW